MAGGFCLWWFTDAEPGKRKFHLYVYEEQGCFGGVANTAVGKKNV